MKVLKKIIMNSKINFYLIRLCLAAFVFVFTIVAFVYPFTIFHKIIELQPGSQFVKFSTELSMSAFIIIGLLLLFTFLFGRFYCSVICPFGILQDLIGAVLKRKTGKSKNFYKTRYFITAIVFGLLIGGSVVGFKVLDPFVNFGVIESAILGKLTIHAILVFAIISLLVFFKNRIFCTVLCPIGTILGICSKYGIFKLEINSNCTKCNQCEKECPTGCIDSGSVDNERCIRCLRCINGCPQEAINYGRKR